MTDPFEGIGGIEDRAPVKQHSRVRQPVLICLFVISALVEVVLTGADLHLWGTPRWRAMAFADAAFWPGLLDNWPRNYLLQPYLMFASYGFLHAGLIHLGVNMLTLFSLGPAIADRVGQVRLLQLYVVAIVGGAFGFALLASGTTPMVGASGGLFGLAGALLSWELADRQRRRLSLAPVWRALIMLVGLNIVLWWAMYGQLAWQTHLGGFLAGWAFARLHDYRTATRSP